MECANKDLTPHSVFQSLANSALWNMK